ncbi:alpha-acetolactate decarboxylase [Aspergillus avenaceus]|uniref:Alpha-acetolactate decarboxylase n=1 Tax=Aspergillus avenaceus TaxID=36643 RepID=A0A5N6TWZ2_ASPAV|nr:alpha-acetolactate decarboxylase [Aspergillus avenaceus]
MSPNNLYQYSVISALMQGVARTGPTINQVLCHGDHGLGTVDHINGEVIVVDGLGVEATDVFPFIMMTHFKPTLSKRLPSLNMSNLQDGLSPLLPSRQNCFLSVRVDGRFDRVTFRVIPAQTQTREPLLALAQRQQMHSVENVRGLLFGFWSPSFTNGFSVSGFHLHFLSDDRSAGGHVTGFEAGDAKISAAVLKEYQVELPQDEDFHEVPIRGFGTDDMHAAEG